MRVLFINNLCPEYRVRPFEILAKRHEVTFCFYSAGGEPTWDPRRPQGHLEAREIRLRGFSPLPRLRVTPGLVPLILNGDWDVIIKCINGRFALPTSYALAKYKKIPFILWTETWMWPASLMHWLAKPLVQRIYRGADAVCVSGGHVVEFLQKEGVDPSKTFLVPQNVDPEIYGRDVGLSEMDRLRVAHGIAYGPVVLFVGRLVPQKGLEDLLSAFKIVAVAHPATLVIVGDGPSRSHLELVAQRSLPGRVRFLGYLESRELPAIYSLASCLVLPSRTTSTIKEVWGLVVNEAFHQGVPVVVTDAVGAAAGGLVRHGRNGFVVPEGSIGQLADRIDCILADATLRDRLSTWARQSVRDWSPEAMSDGFCRAIEQVTSGHSVMRVA